MFRSFRLSRSGLLSSSRSRSCQQCSAVCLQDGSRLRFFSQPAYTSDTLTSQQEQPESALGRLQRAFHDATRRNNAQFALQLLHAYEREGGHASLPMYNRIISMHARRRDVEAAAEAARQLRAAGLHPDIYTYASLMNACSKAQHPPYDLPVEFARQAQRLYNEMIAAGIRPNSIVIHTLMDCQAKAGLVDETFSSFQLLAQHGIRPVVTTFNILISACGRVRNPFRAQDVVERLMPAAGVAPDVVTWNSLLSAFARARHIDGAYRTWQEMQRAGVVPDRLTQRVLAEAFAGNPGLAADLVAEAVGLRQEMLDHAVEGATASQALPSTAGNPPASSAVASEAASGVPSSGISSHAMLRVHRQDGGQLEELGRQLAADVAVEQPLFLDLHGLSQPAARVAILQRLEYLVTQNVSWSKLCVKGMSGEGSMPASWRDGSRQHSSHTNSKASSSSNIDNSNNQRSTASSSSSSSHHSAQAPHPNMGRMTQSGTDAQDATRISRDSVSDPAYSQNPAEISASGRDSRTNRQPTDTAASHAATGPQPGSSRAVRQPGQAARSATETATSASELDDALGPKLCIVTGLGKHSVAQGGGSLQSLAQDVLQSNGLKYVQVAGRLYVPHAELVRYLKAQRGGEMRSRLLHSIGMRYLLLAGTMMSGTVASLYLVPKLAGV